MPAITPRYYYDDYDGPTLSPFVIPLSVVFGLLFIGIIACAWGRSRRRNAAGTPGAAKSMYAPASRLNAGLAQGNSRVYLTRAERMAAEERERQNVLEQERAERRTTLANGGVQTQTHRALTTEGSIEPPPPVYSADAPPPTLKEQDYEMLPGAQRI